MVRRVEVGRSGAAPLIVPVVSIIENSLAELSTKNN